MYELLSENRYIGDETSLVFRCLHLNRTILNILNSLRKRDNYM